jgi:hypothetical protein
MIRAVKNEKKTENIFSLYFVPASVKSWPKKRVQWELDGVVVRVDCWEPSAQVGAGLLAFSFLSRLHPLPVFAQPATSLTEQTHHCLDAPTGHW